MLGNQLEPGITADVESAPAISTGNNSPGTPLLVGGADLESGEANANEIHAVGRAPTARRLFGESSRLTNAIIGALNNNAMPVKVVAPAVSQASHDIGGIGSEKGTLDNSIKEDISAVTITVDGSTKDVRFVYRPVSGITVESGNAVINPATRNFKLDTTPTDTGSIEYDALDQTEALNTVQNHEGNVDFLTPLKENENVVRNALNTGKALASNYNLPLVIAGVPPQVDADEYELPFDDSRIQMKVPPRIEGGASALGAYAGMRANIGLTTTPINQRIQLQGRLIRELDDVQRGKFIDKNVTPMEAEGLGARVVDDLTTVSEDNKDEQNLKYSTTRLIMDFLIAESHDIEDGFVGDFNSAGALGTMKKLLSKRARQLKNSNLIHEYDIGVELVDPTEARVTFQANAAEPIRFIDNDFILGN